MRREARSLVVLWALDLALLAVSIFWPFRPSVDMFYHDTYFVIALPHVFLIVWLLVTLPLVFWTLRRRRGA